MNWGRFKREDSVYFIAFALLAIGLYLNEPRGAGDMGTASAVVEAVLVGAILAVIPWGIVKIVVRIMRKPSYPAS